MSADIRHTMWKRNIRGVPYIPGVVHNGLDKWFDACIMDNKGGTYGLS